jgi:mono/diheme cytochrome c family protein
VKAAPILLLVVLAAVGLAGCGQPPPASFAPNTQKLDPLIPEARAEITSVLNEYFGNPNQLVAWQKFSIDYGKGDEDLPKTDPRHDDGWRLKEGRNLYMTHCVHCHGVAGDGNGPTARFLNPLPRDYRQGIFKFKSTLAALKPSRADLRHTLEQGIPGTYMPSFVLLGEEKLLLLVDYVRWLSIRGNMEIKMAEELAALFATEQDVAQKLAEDEAHKLKRADVIEELKKSIKEEFPAVLEDIIVGPLAEAWATAEQPESVVVPKVKRTPPTKESIENGRKLFLSQVKGKKTECLECHGEAGRGDGGNTEKFWPIPGTKPERKYEEPGLHDIWGHPQKPRDLTRGIYRGGRRPIDIFRRVHEGIPGTQMTSFANVLVHEEIWDVVNYVLSLPFDGEESAYPTKLKEEEEAGKQNVATAED